MGQGPLDHERLEGDRLPLVTRARLTPPSSRRAGLSSDDGDSRSLLQSRLRVLHLVLCVISAIQMLVSLRVSSSMDVHRGADDRVLLVLYLHVFNVALTGTSWLVLRFWPIGKGALGAIDVAVAGLLAISGGFMIVMFPAYYRLDMGILMVISQLLVGRAALVPSTAGRTVAVGLATTLPFMIATTLVFHAAPLPSWLSPANPQIIQTGVWATFIVTLSALTSRVIYRLNRKVAEAMQLGQYTVERLIGKGGMGTVYLARHCLLRRPTALKVLESDACTDEAIVRFEREVQTTSELAHPNTVAIYDYGRTPDDRFYYAMEYVDGLDLESLVASDGPLPPARVVHILAQVCGALAEAHDRGLIHRDIKPANIMVCDRGFQPDFVKVLDFGLVRAPGAGSAAGLSREHTVLGTPHYIAPESILTPAEVDARADIYAVGAVAYFLLAGRPPLDGGSAVEIMTKQVRELPPPPSEISGRPLPRALEALVLACLAKDPGDRPASMAALRDAIEALDIEPWTAAAARAWWRERAQAGAVSRIRPAAQVGSPATVSIDLARRRAAGLEPTQMMTSGGVRPG
jgi:eukaryotic-like serine/threonine-protein kinase